MSWVNYQSLFPQAAWLMHSESQRASDLPAAWKSEWPRAGLDAGASMELCIHGPLLQNALVQAECAKCIILFSISSIFSQSSPVIIKTQFRTELAWNYLWHSFCTYCTQAFSTPNAFTCLSAGCVPSMPYCRGRKNAQSLFFPAGHAHCIMCTCITILTSFWNYWWNVFQDMKKYV